MNTIYDKALMTLLVDTLDPSIKVFYSVQESGLDVISRKEHNGEIKLPSVVFNRSGLIMYMNEMTQFQYQYEGGNYLGSNLFIEDDLYLDTMTYYSDIEYEIMVFTNTLADSYELMEELIIKLKLYPSLKLQYSIDVPYETNDGIEKRYKDTVKWESSVELQGGGSGVNIENKSELVNNFGDTAGLYVLSITCRINHAPLIRFRINNKIKEILTSSGVSGEENHG